MHVAGTWRGLPAAAVYRAMPLYGSVVLQPASPTVRAEIRLHCEWPALHAHRHSNNMVLVAPPHTRVQFVSYCVLLVVGTRDHSTVLLSWLRSSDNNDRDNFAHERLRQVLDDTAFNQRHPAWSAGVELPWQYGAGSALMLSLACQRLQHAHKIATASQLCLNWADCRGLVQKRLLGQQLRLLWFVAANTANDRARFAAVYARNYPGWAQYTRVWMELGFVRTADNAVRREIASAEMWTAKRLPAGTRGPIFAILASLSRCSALPNELARIIVMFAFTEFH